MAKEKNTNCLEGLKCHKCGSLEPFDIRCSATFEVSDYGTEDYCEVEWEHSSECKCCRCGFAGTVANFEKMGAENA